MGNLRRGSYPYGPPGALLPSPRSCPPIPPSSFSSEQLQAPRAATRPLLPLASSGSNLRTPLSPRRQRCPSRACQAGSPALIGQPRPGERRHVLFFNKGSFIEGVRDTQKLFKGSTHRVTV
ncbi:hypothetical protein NDU88_000842 [Pleurodeles waltl]|uniref:Uncharacterized protein n=1 Tax=Pleurodeles waltl TaxID=8319 RepID=A0AAV7MK18_PLEWA|nr:hypothetical protein NDU88_000842 [Pleurodeles waltl]